MQTDVPVITSVCRELICVKYVTRFPRVDFTHGSVIDADWKKPIVKPRYEHSEAHQLLLSTPNAAQVPYKVLAQTTPHLTALYRQAAAYH